MTTLPGDEREAARDREFVRAVIREADEQLAELWQRGVTTRTIAAEPALAAFDRLLAREQQKDAEIERLKLEVRTLRRGANSEAWKIADKRAEQYRAEIERLRETLELAEPWIGVSEGRRGNWCPQEVREAVREALDSPEQREL